MTEFLLPLALLFVLAKVFGEICERVELPSLLGEIMAGVILGPMLLGMIAPEDPTFVNFAEIGIIMLLFVAGFEQVDIKDVLENKKVSIAISAVSCSLPLIAIVLVMIHIGYPLVTALFLGVALSATSMGITVRALMEIGKITTKAGKTILGSLVINDIVGLILLTVVMALTTAVGSPDIVVVLLRIFLGIVVFFMIFVVAERVMPLIIRYSVRFRVEEAQLSIVFVSVLLAAYTAQAFGLSTIIGAFFAGIALSRSSILESESFSQKLSSISYGLFVPIFFAIIGTQLSFNNLFAAGQLAFVFLLVVLTIHVGGGFAITKFFKYKTSESLLTGFGMLPLGEVTLIVMTGLITQGTLAPEKFGGVDSLHTLFSAVLLLLVILVVLTPLMMKLVARRVKD